MIPFFNLALIFTDGILLEELEFHNDEDFVVLDGFNYMPIAHKGMIQMKQLTYLYLRRTFSNVFIQDLVQTNPNLRKFTVT